MIYGFHSLQDVERVNRTVNASERMRDGHHVRRAPGGRLRPYPRIGFFNDSGATVPSFGVMLFKGSKGQNSEKNGPAQGVCVTIKQPDTYGCQYNALVADEGLLGNGYANQTYGAAQLDPPFIAAYDSTDGTPAFGDRWGPRASTWLLKKNTGGFFVIGVYDSTKHYALVWPAPMLSIRGTIASDAAPDSNNTLTVYTGAYGAEATTSQTIANVRNASDCTIKSGSGAKIHRAVYDWSVPGWEFDVGRFRMICCCVSSDTPMYASGGANSAFTTLYAITDKILWTAETASAVSSANLRQARAGAAGLSNPGVAAYFAGGETTSSAEVSTADKITFSNDTDAAVTTANLSAGRDQLAALSNTTTAGYFAGGSTTGGTAGQVKTADKLVFSGDATSAVSTANLSQARLGLAGMTQGSTKGYFAGGRDGFSHHGNRSHRREDYLFQRHDGRTGQRQFVCQAIAIERRRRWIYNRLLVWGTDRGIEHCR